MRKIAPLGRWLRLAVILGALGSVGTLARDGHALADDESQMYTRQ